MRISTSLFYDRINQRLGDLNTRAATLQTQIATGKKYSDPSENAAVAQQVAAFEREDADAAVYGANMTLAGSLLSQTDSTLKAIQSQIQRAVELTVQAGNETLSLENRRSIGDELDAIVGSLMGLANTQDARGRPLFGSPDGTPAVQRTATGFVFNNTRVSDIPIADGQSVQATEDAERVFQVGGSDLLTVIATVSEALRSGVPGNAAQTALGGLKTATDNVSMVRASVGARAARVDLQEGLLADASLDRAELRSAMEDVDATTAIVELQKTMTVLSAAQSSFAKLQSLSLFDYLR